MTLLKGSEGGKGVGTSYYVYVCVYVSILWQHNLIPHVAVYLLLLLILLCITTYVVVQRMSYSFIYHFIRNSWKIALPIEAEVPYRGSGTVVGRCIIDFCGISVCTHHACINIRFFLFESVSYYNDTNRGVQRIKVQAHIVMYDDVGLHHESITRDIA